ncbi:WcbI family polysaccharide biosynthesis putative acetyltransferase [Vreelandella titanicae]|uniref:Polysaccharide biosynthesis enzyme WcbI domain-containing protein n=1 Tax=Vreelandella titanicae TaxID=664683 RepID=A0A558J1P2_9GAMM|nr:WcbI family polysaccharide biosynthesis putative acetyltransferase [Halomonas titanicae]TVU87588.1 hypothetical protein FQP89_20795 [Halomonas titanicae]
MNFTVYGNCQAKALANNLLRNAFFKDEFFYLPLKAVQDIKEEEIYKILSEIELCDLIIEQVVSDKYKYPDLSSTSIRKFKKMSAKSIVIPSIYFDGLFPSFLSLPLRSVLGFNHCFFIIKAFINGITIRDCIDVLENEKLFTRENSAFLFDLSLSELKKREDKNRVDIKVSDIIEKNYKSSLLFDTCNHPRSKVFDLLSCKIWKSLGYENVVSDSSDFNPDLGMVQLMPYRSTQLNLGLEYHIDKFVDVNNNLIPIEKVVTSFYQDYSNSGRGVFDMEKKLDSSKFLYLDTIAKRLFNYV